MKDKLFFYGNYEAFRQKQQVAQNYTIPDPQRSARRQFPLLRRG